MATKKTKPPKTTFAGGANIFTGESSKIDPDKIEIVDEAPPVRRSVRSRFEGVFSRIQPGQAFAVPTEQVNAVANAFRKWLEARKMPYLGVVKTAFHNPNTPGFGRVYYVKEQK